MRTELFWLLSFCGLAALSLVCGLLVGPQLAAVWPNIQEQVDRFHRLPPLAKVALLVFVAGFIAYGSTKTNQVNQTGGTNIVEIVEGGTNGVEIAEGGTNDIEILDGGETNAPLMMLMMAMPFSGDQPPTVTLEDIARGWQQWEVRTNFNISYEMPENATLATNWCVRGAYEDVKPFDFGSWRFPFGTNEYSSLWAFTWGKVRFALGDTNAEVVAVGAPMSAVPYHSRLWSAADTNDSRFITWENFALNRDTNTPVNAQIELLTTGDFVTRSNDVETVYRRVDDFDWDGDGIPNWSDWDPYWYDGDCTGQEDWWAAYVNEMVGTGLENGYYKLTATFPQADFHRTVLTVGYDEIVVAEPGEYVFLLEKGEDYEFDIEPFSPDVSFEVVDDIPLLPSLMRSYLDWGWWSDWSIDGGNLNFTVPSFNRPGYCCWMPTFQATPPMSHLGPGDSPETFTAVLTDYTYSQSVEYYWHSDDWNIDISDPYSEETEIDIYEMPRWQSSSVTVTATFGNHTLESTCSFTYGEHETPQTTLELSVPGALLLNSNNVDSAKIGQVDVTFIPDIPTNGTLLLYCIDGAERVRLIGSCSRSVTGEESFSVDVVGVGTSEELDDVTLCATFTPEGGGVPLSAQSSLTVVQVNDVVLPGAPNDGLVISTGTSVALDLDVLPEGADELLSVIYKVRRLRGNGTYTDWEYAAGNYWGTDAIYNPSDGGIYQVQALAGLGWGAEDERYYRWEEDEIDGFGIRCAGENKAFGVVDESWQWAVLNCAKGFFASRLYARSAELAGQYGFSRLPAKTWKCNMFVAHRLRQCGLPVAELHTYWGQPLPPLANEWAGGIDLAGWERCSSMVEVQPGWVVACPSSEGSGHVGIVDFDGAGVAAGTAIVNRAYPGFIEGPCVYRKYIGAEE